MKYQPVIGLEVHVELKTKSKMFCGCAADYFGKEPNTHCCPICLGMPGALPVPNKKAIEYCVMIGLALNCEIPSFAKFDRKNYFYPDLPKGYQISQYDKPFCINGYIILSNGRKIGIRRVHMEEDTAKLTHAKVDGLNVSLIDFNRSGVPLVEIVTEPDFATGDEVVEYLKKLQQIVRSLGVSNANMEKGDMRLEPNISLKKPGEALPKYKVEVKNINSFRFVAKAIDFEINRQSGILDEGKTPQQETRGYNEDKSYTVSQRSKEEAHDYRYFPEPDIPPIRWVDKEINFLRKKITGKLPEERINYLVQTFGISGASGATLVTQGVAQFYESTAKLGQQQGVDPGKIASYIINRKIDPSTPPQKIISDLKAKTADLINDQEELERLAKQAIEENPKAMEDFKKGKENALQVLVGGVMKKSEGKANAEKVREILKKILKV